MLISMFVVLGRLKKVLSHIRDCALKYLEDQLCHCFAVARAGFDEHRCHREERCTD